MTEKGGFLNWISLKLQEWACCSGTISSEGAPGLLTLHLGKHRQYPEPEF